MANPDVNLYNIAYKIKILRESKGLTQKDLAKILEVNTSLILKYEKSAILPSLENFKKLTEFFNVTADELLGNSNKDFIDFDEIIQSRIDTTGLSDEDIQYIKTTVKFLKKKY